MYMYHPSIERRGGEEMGEDEKRGEGRSGGGRGEEKFIETMQMATHKVFLLHKEDCLEKL